MSSTSFFLFLALLCFFAGISAAPTSRLLSSRPSTSSALPTAIPASPDAAGVTLQLFMDSSCNVNISSAETLVAPIDGTCQNPNPAMSFSVTCKQDSTSTVMNYGVYTQTGCKGTAMNSIYAAGTGKCLPTQIISNGQPAPIPLYSVLTCNTALEEVQPVGAAPIIEGDKEAVDNAAAILLPSNPVSSRPNRFNPRSIQAHPRNALHFARNAIATAMKLAKETEQ